MNDPADLVAGEIVADDDVSRPQFRCQELLDISEESRPVHRAIKEARSTETIMTQRHHQGGRMPVAMRHRALAALAANRAPILTRHFGVEACFIKEDQMTAFPARLLLAPELAGDLQIRPVLFGGAQRFFYSSAPTAPSGARGR